MKETQHRNQLIAIALLAAILIIGVVSIVGINLRGQNIEKEKLELQEKKFQKEKLEEQEKKAESLESEAKYEACVQEAEDDASYNYEINSTSTEIDENGNEYYIGDSDIFDEIGKTEQKDKDRCRQAYL